MTSPTITLMDAYMIERLLARGISKDVLVQSIYEHTVDQYQSPEDSYDYSELNAVVQGNEAVYENAIRNGYAVSYLTVNGLKNLLKMKYGFEAEKDYIEHESKLEQLTVTRHQLEVLTLLVGRIWTVQITNERFEDSLEISIIHVSLT